MEQNPFPEYKIDSSDFLNELSGRSKCSKCQKSRKYYCYTCYVAIPEIVDKVPQVKLPLKVDIIKHPGETDGKSTAVHAGVLASDSVTIYTYPCIPDYDTEKVVLVFPNETSKTLEQLAEMWNRTPQSEGGKESQKCSNRLAEVVNNGEPAKKIQKLEHNTEREPNEVEKSDHSISKAENHEKEIACPLERVVFIDSTWNQTKAICNDERLRGLRCVELRTHKSKFWRHQKDIPDTYLSTIEAIYYFLREYHDSFLTTSYTGQYDNLLFFFKFMYSKIRTMYDGGKELKAYKSRKEKLSPTTV